MRGHTPVRYLLLIGVVVVLSSGALVSVTFPKRVVSALAGRGLPDVVTSVLPAVVNITAETGLGWAARPMQTWLCGTTPPAKPADMPTLRDGTGFVIDPSGFIVTNRHVVEGADTITVTLQDSTVLQATVVGVSPCDLALLKVSADRPLPALKFADSDSVRVGDPVVAIGNAFGLGSSVSVRIVSALHRNIRLGPFDDFIQTDAPINHGNSGGPLLNAKGQVIGVNSVALNGSVGLGFAFPSNDVKMVAEQIRKDGRVHPGWLGVMVQQVTPEIAVSLGLEKASGAIVTAVSDAAHGGFQEGDVIMAFDGKDVQGDRAFVHDVALSPIGLKTSVALWRDGSRHSVPVTIAEWNDKQASAPMTLNDANRAQRVEVHDFGLRLEVLTDSLRTKYNVEADSNGVLVTDIQPGTAGAESDLERGDLIVEVQRTPVRTIDDVRARLEDLRKQNRPYALILVHKQGDARWATLRLSNVP